MKKLVWLCLASLVATESRAEEPPSGELSDASFEGLDLDSLLSLEVSVASLKATSLRESPGIVSVVTRDEMLSMGARDLIDVLRLIPGFFFGVDVQGVVGVGLRGNWGHEGKILLIIDGQEMNELGYQTLQFGHHYPVESLERIEIIRGPGSAIYGGNAELGVIKVVTRGGAELHGARAAVRYAPPHGFYSGEGDKTGFADVTLEAGDVSGEVEWSVSAMLGRSVRSDATFSSLDEAVSYGLGKESTIRPAFVSAGAAYSGLRLRLIYDGYGLDSKDAFDVPTTLTHPYRHGGFYGELSGSFEVAPGLTLMPRLNYKRQQAWYGLFEDMAYRQEQLDAGLYNQRTFTRYLANLTVSWDAFAEANLIVGAEAFYDRGEAVGTEEDTRDLNWFTSDDGTLVPALDFVTAAGFAQFLWPNEIVNVTAGGRLEVHSVFGVAAVPRLALTKVFDNGLHVKLLGAQGYRTPSFLNKSLEKVVDPNNKVKPERTSVLEAELGYRVTDELSFTGNGSITQIKDPIIYTYNADVDAEAYLNRGQTGTLGGELEGRWRGRGVDAMLAYAYYRRLGDAVEEYTVQGSLSLLGAARHKLSLRVKWDLLPWLALTPTLSWSFGRFGYQPGTPDAPTAMDHEPLLGLAATATDLGVPGLDVLLAVHDLLDTVERFPQPYASGHSPLSGPGRQVLLRLSYEYGR